MKNGFYFYLSVAVGMLIVALLAFILLSSGPAFKYLIVKDGVEFVSNEGQPADLLDAVRNSGSIIVSPQFVGQGPENSYMTNVLTSFNSVLVAEGKQVTVIARLLDSKGEISSCISNFGDPKKGEELAAKACNRLLSESGGMKIFISLPDTSLQRPRILLTKGEVRISSSSFDNISHASFVFLSSLYPEAGAIISSVNDVVKKL